MRRGYLVLALVSAVVVGLGVPAPGSLSFTPESAAYVTNPGWHVWREGGVVSGSIPGWDSCEALIAYFQIADNSACVYGSFLYGFARGWYVMTGNRNRFGGNPPYGYPALGPFPAMDSAERAAAWLRENGWTGARGLSDWRVDEVASNASCGIGHFDEILQQLYCH